MRKHAFYIFLFFLFFYACSKKEIGPQIEKNSPLSGYKILVLNEGNFGFANASITAYNPYTQEKSNNAYFSKNGTALGDVLQSASVHQGNYYFVLNNSGKILVCDSASLAYQHQITGFNSPRQVLFYQGKLFVSDLKQNAIYVVNEANHTIVETINTTGWTEHLFLHNNILYALDRGNYLNNTGNNKIYLINPNTHQKIDSIASPLDPNSMVLDKNENLWVLTSGGFSAENPTLLKINTATHQITHTFTFPNLAHSPTQLSINGDKDVLYFLNQNVYSMSISATELPDEPLIESHSKNFYGLSIHPQSGEIYVTDAKDYVQTGTVYRHYPNGNLIDSFEAGIIPQGIVF